MKRLLLVASALVGSFATAGCNDSVVCGRGSIEIDGECVSEAQAPVPSSCGAGTEFDAVSGACVNTLLEESLGVCGPNTVRIVGDDGVPVCEGVGECADCSLAPTCPQPSAPTRVSVCGRVYDLETTQPINDDPADPGDLPTLVGKVYDPIAFINNPATATVLAEVDFDACGYFHVEVELPFSGKIGIAIDDAAGSSDDNFVPTGVAKEVMQGERAYMSAFALRSTTDLAWTMLAGNPVGSSTLSEDGAYVPIYIDTSQPPVGPFNGTPKPGVKIAIGSSIDAPNDFYFSDADPLTRTAIDASLDATGASGSGILIGSPGINNSYTGQGPAGCDWPVNQAGMVGGAVVVHVRETECQ